MSSAEEFSKESLQKSMKVVGRLYPKLVNQDGKILDGVHRGEVDENWETKIIETKNRIDEILIRMHAHHRRRVPQEETQALILELAQELEKTGIQKENISTELIRILPYSQSYIWQLLPQEYKKPEKVEAGKISATITEQKQPQIEAPLTAPKEPPLVECEYCHMTTRHPYVVDGHPFCDQSHFKRAEMSGLFKHSQKEPQKPKVYKETPEQRRAIMQPLKSAFEESIVNDLRSEFPLDTDKEYCLVKAIPDFVAFGKKAGFIDGPVHEGKEDRDERIRELLQSRHGLVARGFPFKADTKEERERVKSEIRQWLKET